MKTSTLAKVFGSCLLLSGCPTKEQGDRAAAVVKVAGVLEKDIKVANEMLKELASALETANAALGQREYPKELPAALAGLRIPFDAGKLNHRGLTDLPSPTMQRLLDYTAGVHVLNAETEKLKALLPMVQPSVEKAWKEEKESVVHFSVVLRTEGRGVIAELVPNQEPFGLAQEWPKSYRVLRLRNGKPEGAQLSRWEKGAPKDGEPVVIPVDPKTTMAFTTDRMVLQLRAKLVERIEDIQGKDKDTPSATVGLLRKGEDLENELHKLALAESSSQ